MRWMPGILALLGATASASAQTVTHTWKFDKYAVGQSATGGGQTLDVVMMPDIIQLPDGTYRMYYGAAAAGLTYIRSATSTDGLNWLVELGNRLAGDTDGQTPGPDTIPANEGMISGPSVVRLADGSYRMYYQASTTGVNNPPDFRVKSATSPDGLTWTREGTVIDIGGASPFSLAGHSRVIRFSDTDYVIFVSGNYGTPASQPSDLVMGPSTNGTTFSNWSILYTSGHDPAVVRPANGTGYWLFYGYLLDRQRSVFSTDGKIWPASANQAQTIQQNAAGTELTEAINPEHPGDRCGLELPSGEILLFVNWGDPANIALLKLQPGSISGPSAGTVNDGTGADIDTQTSTTTLSANWSGFTETSGNGIGRYDWAIGTTAGGTQVQPWTSVGTSTNATNSSLSLTNGTTYYVLVRAVLNLGLPGTIATSDGVKVDTGGTGGPSGDGAGGGGGGGCLAGASPSAALFGLMAVGGFLALLGWRIS